MSEIAPIISLDIYRRRARAGGVVDPVIGHWKCRDSMCVTRVGITQTAVDALALFNAELHRHRQRAILEHEVMFCAPHAAARGATR